MNSAMPRATGTAITRARKAAQTVAKASGRTKDRNGPYGRSSAGAVRAGTPWATRKAATRTSTARMTTPAPVALPEKIRSPTRRTPPCRVRGAGSGGGGPDGPGEAGEAGPMRSSLGLIWVMRAPGRGEGLRLSDHRRARSARADERARRDHHSGDRVGGGLDPHGEV